MKDSLLKLSIITLLGSSLSAQAAETLSELYSRSVGSDGTYLIADVERQAAKEQYTQARSELLPSAGVSASAGKTWSNDYDVARIGYTLSLSQPLYKPSSSLSIDRAGINQDKVEEEFKSVDQALMMRVANAYFDVLAAYDALAFSRAKKTASLRQLEQSRQRFDVGLIAITDVQEAQAGYDADIASEIAAMNSLENAHETLRQIVGKYDKDNLAALSESIPLLSPDPADTESWVKAAMDNNPRLKALRYAADMAQKSIDISRSAHLPQVNLVGSHENAYRDSDAASMDGDYQDLGVSVQMSMNFDVSGGIRASTREARIRYQQALQQYEHLADDIQTQVLISYRNVLSGISLVKAQKQAILSSQTAYEAAQTGFDVGTRTTVDILTAQRNLLDAKRAHALARYQYVLATLQLKQAAGLLTEEELNKLDQWFGRTVEESFKKAESADMPEDAAPKDTMSEDAAAETSAAP